MWLYDGEKTRVAYYGEKYRKIKSIKATIEATFFKSSAFFAIIYYKKQLSALTTRNLILSFL